MSDLLRRAQNAKRLVDDVSLPKHEGLRQSLQSFSGLQINGIAPEVGEPLEAALVEFNRLFDGDDLEVDDLRQLDEADVQRGLEVLQVAASRAIEAELDRVVAELAKGEQKLPVAAIREAREHKDLMVPRLIRVLREASVAAREGHVPKGNAHFLALFLLSEFQASESLPAILEAISLPGELPFDLFGDAVTSTLARILAQFAGDSPERLDALAADRGLNQYVRWEAAQAYIYLVRDGRMPRNVAVERLRQLLRQAIDHEDVDIIWILIGELTDLSPKEAIADIAEAYDKGLVEPFTINREEVDSSIALGEEAVRKSLARYRPTGIADTIEELQSWASFREEPAKTPVKPVPALPRPPILSTSRHHNSLTAPLPAKRVRPGRNEPCPCGSGKKFKKCCGFQQ